MLTPNQLHRAYSLRPCTEYLQSPYSQLSAQDVFGSLTPYGAGTPFNWKRIIKFLKQVKYPCVYDTPDFNTIKDTGKAKVCMSFKILQEVDIEAYTEKQPTVRSGTSYAVRNCCDLTRACYYAANKQWNELYPNQTPKEDIAEKKWKARMATEYLEYYAHNSLPDCLMMIGPDLVDPLIAKYFRSAGVKVQANEQSVLGASGAAYETVGGEEDAQEALNKALTLPGMECLPKTSTGVAGAGWFCFTPPGSNTKECRSCNICPKDPITNAVLDPNHPCCRDGTIFYYNECCNHSSNSLSDVLDFSIWLKSDDGSFNGTVSGGRVGDILKHIGILERKNYDGYANFTNQCSGNDPPIILDDIFFHYFRSKNKWDYEKSEPKPASTIITNPISRVRTISLILDATVNNSPSTTTNAESMTDTVKDLLWNGYGILLLTNVGFPNQRSSLGLAYPDRIWYHTYNIIGYDDTKLIYPECVYLLHSAFGDWISGGSPIWGPIPTGSFLVTESILRCIIQYYPADDFYACKAEPCNPFLYDCNNLSPSDIESLAGCGASREGLCAPYYCTPQQQSYGLLFALSMTQGFPKQVLNHHKYLPIDSYKKLLNNPKVLYEGSDI